MQETEVVAPETPTPAPPPEKPEAPEKEVIKEERVVPYAALREERESRKEFQRQLRERDAQQAKLQERLDALAKRWEQPEEKAPDREADPLGNFAHKIDKIDKRFDDIDARERKKEEEAQNQRQWAEFSTRVNSAFNSFRTKQPDLDKAVAYLEKDRREEFEALGYADSDIAQLIQNDRLAIAQKALQDGRNPAEVAYNLAKRRGYKAEENAEEKIERIANGQDKAKSLSNVGGSSPGNLSAETLLAMDDEEFAKFAANPKNWRKAMGG